MIKIYYDKCGDSMDDYILFLEFDEPITNGYFSNKMSVTSGDLIYLDDFTTAYEDVVDLQSELSGEHGDVCATGALIVSRKEYLNLISHPEFGRPRKVLDVLFSSDRDFYEKLMGRDGPPSEYIGNLIYRDYFGYLASHTSEIKNSLVKYVHIKGLAIDEKTTSDELMQIFYAYYGSKNDLVSIPYRKIRDTYVELSRLTKKEREKSR